MKIYFGEAFKSQSKIEGRICRGNPASVVVFDNTEDISKTNSLSKIAKEQNQPITCFLKQRKIPNEFDIRFFTPSGDEVNICGHGSLVSSRILKQHYNLKENKIIFYLNKDICIGNMLDNSCTEVIYIDDEDKSLIQLVKVPYNKTKTSIDELETLENILNTLSLKNNDIEDFIKFNEYHDFIMILKNANKLKNLSPDFNLMIPHCNKLNCRSVSFSAKSDLKAFDYETRVFAPHIAVNEDIVCASINSVIADYWSKMLNKNELNVLYPYHWNEGTCGGIQNIKVSNDFILLGEL